MALKRSLYYREFKGGQPLPSPLMHVEKGDLVRTEALVHLPSGQRSQFHMAVKFNTLGLGEDERGLTVIRDRLRSRRRAKPEPSTTMGLGDDCAEYKATSSIPIAGTENPEVILHPRDIKNTPRWAWDLYLSRPWSGWGRDTGGACVEWPKREQLGHVKAPFVGVIVTVFNKPDRALACIDAVLERTKYPNFKLFILDDGSDDFTHESLTAYEGRAEVLRHRNCGYLETANRGAREAIGAGCDAVVFVNSDVRVTHGWLSSMVRAHLITGADIVNPMCNQQGPISLPLADEVSLSAPRLRGGMGYQEAAMVASFIPPMYPPATPAIGACMLVSRAAWDKHGPFNGEVYGSGYGEECELWASVVDSGGHAIVADDAYVYHESHGVHKNAQEREREGFETFMGRWGSVYRQKSVGLRLWPDKTAKIRSMALSMRPSKCPVRFIMANIGPYGGVYCALRLVDELNERGFNASAEYMKRERHEFKLTTGPNKHDDIPALKRLTREDVNRGGFIVATHWFTGEVMASIYNINDDFIPVAFWQDREDMFTEPDGTKAVSASSVAAYTKIPNRVVNADWVGSSALSDLDIDSFTHIPVGVDTLKFYPGKRNGGPVRILVMHRPSTPRRGAKRIREMYPKLKASLGDRAIIETVGEPCLWSDHHYGKLSQDGVAELMRQVDILVEPSEYQGFGLPGLEAMASGICVVSTDNKGVHEYGVHRHNCLIEGEKTLFALILEAAESRELRHTLGAAGRETSLKFDWSVIADRWASHLVALYRDSGLTRYVDTLPSGQ